MAEMYTDPSGKTYLYIMYVESITLSTEMEHVAQQQIHARWYVDSETFCSEPISLVAGEAVPARYCSFLVATHEANQRSRQVILSFSFIDSEEHLCVDFLDMDNFSTDENFKVTQIEVKNQAGVVATVDLHTAVQQRWDVHQAVAPAPVPYFVDPQQDSQAKHLFTYIVPADEPGDDGNAPQEAERQRKAEEEAAETKRRENQESEEKRRREEQEKEKSRQQQEEESKRKREDEARQDQDRKRQEREEDERRKKRDEEDRERKEAEEREAREARERDSAAERRKEDEERDRRRRIEEEERRSTEREPDRYDRNRDGHRDRSVDKDRERDRDRDRDRDSGRNDRDDLHGDRDRDRDVRDRDRDRDRDVRERDSGDRGGNDRDRERERQRQLDLEDAERERRRRDEEERRELQRLRERRQWEEDRERLRQDAKRERQREAQERERRAQERKRQNEVVANRLATEEPRSSVKETAPHETRPDTPASSRSGAGTVASVARTGRVTDSKARGDSQHHRRHHDVRDDEAYSNHASPVQAVSARRSSLGGSSTASIPQPAVAHRGAGAASGGRGGGRNASSVPPHGGNNSDSDDCENPFEEQDAHGNWSGAGGGSSGSRAQRGLGRGSATNRGHGNRTHSAGAHGRRVNQQFAAAAPMNVRLEQLKAMSGPRPGLIFDGGVQEYTDSEAVAAAAHSLTASGEGQPVALLDQGSQVRPVHQDNRSPRPSPRGAAGQHDGSVYGRGSTPGRNGYSAPRMSTTKSRMSPRASPRTRTNEVSVQTGIGGSKVGAEVVAAALADAAQGGVGLPGVAALGIPGLGNVGGNGLGAAPVAAVEECVLRLLLLQRELGGDAAVRALTPRGEEEDDKGRAVLADAAAGLVPRMMQVLEAAKSVCEGNQAKMQAFCKERKLDLDKMGGGGQGYLQPQLTAIDRLKSQYASLLPSSPATSSFAGSGFGGPHHQSVANMAGVSSQRQLQPHFAGYGELSTPRPRQDTAVGGALSPSVPNGGHATANGLPLQHLQQLQQLQLQQLQLQQQQLAAPSPMDTVPMGHAGLADAMGFGAVRQSPLDPGAHGPVMPALRSGGSTPPRAKFRQSHNVAPPIASWGELRSDVSSGPVDPSSQQDMLNAWTAQAGGATGSQAFAGKSPRDDMQHAMWTALGASHAPAVASGAQHVQQPPSTNIGATPDSARSSNDRWNSSGGHGNGPSPRGRGAGPLGTSPLKPASGQAPLRAALEQFRGVAESIAPAAARRAASARQGTVNDRKVDDAGGGAHAVAGSPSPDGRRPREEERAPVAWSKKAAPAEDRYLKILQSLQAKGAAGPAARRLEGVSGNQNAAIAAVRTKPLWSKGAAMDSDSDSPSDRSERRIPARRPLSNDRQAALAR